VPPSTASFDDEPSVLVLKRNSLIAKAPLAQASRL
jgi:hypothetical protein